MQKDGLSFLDVIEVRLKGQTETQSGDYTVYHYGGNSAESGVIILVHNSIVTIVVKNAECDVNLIPLKSKENQ
jgi:hypothetical protein